MRPVSAVHLRGSSRTTFPLTVERASNLLICSGRKRSPGPLTSQKYQSDRSGASSCQRATALAVRAGLGSFRGPAVAFTRLAARFVPWHGHGVNYLPNRTSRFGLHPPEPARSRLLSAVAPGRTRRLRWRRLSSPPIGSPDRRAKGEESDHADGRTRTRETARLRQSHATSSPNAEPPPFVILERL